MKKFLCRHLGSNPGQLCDRPTLYRNAMTLWVCMTCGLTSNKCSSLWPIFHGPLIWPYIFNVIWYMNSLIWDYESVWPEVSNQSRCQSWWPIFYGPVILCYILKTIWCMSIILWDYGQYDTTFDNKINVVLSDL